ncbi:hypothetical protein C464_16332 [Halorubrum coriense DSM 10284]|uniref:Uncharacterized protein n=1 Tax=Halorubrum coriense DSM 10284 TaxID=1227466 RepID=M0EBD6_9EURY|nr:hypothetical protein C464_16332 [Halorubrum coriense DSM 10284]
MVFTQQDEREQLKEPEVQVIPSKRKLKIGVINVMDELLEYCSIVLEDAFCDVRSDLLAVPPKLPLFRGVWEVGFLLPVVVELLSELRLLAATVSSFIYVGEQRLKRCEVTVEV